MLLTSNHSFKILLLEQQLKSQFQMSFLGLLAIYLGVNFFYKPVGILMSHTCYIQRCHDELGFSNCLPASVPIDPSIHLSQNMDSPLLPDPTYYRVLIGKMLHLNNTRSDINYAVGVVTRFTQAPRQAHLKAAIHIMQYLKGTMHLAVLYRLGEEVNLQASPIVTSKVILNNKNQHLDTCLTLVVPQYYGVANYKMR